MSVREKPVASRYLDLKDKERSYMKHVGAVRRARSTINTTQPDTPRRLQVAAVNNARYRRNLKRDHDVNARKITEIDQGRPQTSQQTHRLLGMNRYSQSRTPSRVTRPPLPNDDPRDIDVFASLTRDPLTPPRPQAKKYIYDSISSSSEIPAPSDSGTSRSSASSSVKPSPYITEPPKNHKKKTIDSIKIGYSPVAVVETVEVDDTTDANDSEVISQTTVQFTQEPKRSGKYTQHFHQEYTFDENGNVSDSL